MGGKRSHGYKGRFFEEKKSTKSVVRKGRQTTIKGGAYHGKNIFCTETLKTYTKSEIDNQVEKQFTRKILLR